MGLYDLTPEQLLLLGFPPRRPARDATGLNPNPKLTLSQLLNGMQLPGKNNLLQPQPPEPVIPVQPRPLPSRTVADASRIAPAARSTLPRSFRTPALTLGEKEILRAKEADINRGTIEAVGSAAQWIPPIWAAGVGERLAHEVAGSVRGEGPVSKMALAETALAAVPFGGKVKGGIREWIPSGSAAIRDPKTGKIYKGYMHISALDNAPKSARARLLKELEAETKNVGFVTSENRFLNREQANRFTGGKKGENITTERMKLRERETRRLGERGSVGFSRLRPGEIVADKAYPERRMAVVADYVPDPDAPHIDQVIKRMKKADPEAGAALEKFMKGSAIRDVQVHGTIAPDFEIFNMSDGLGVHVGTPGQAFNRSGALKEMVTGEREEAMVRGHGQRSIATALNIKKPLELTDLGGWEPDQLSRELRDRGVPRSQESIEAVNAWAVGKYTEYGELKKKANEALKRDIEAAGYDGIAYLNKHENVRNGIFEPRTSGWSFIAFKPEQVKSIYGNRKFSPKNPSMYGIVPGKSGPAILSGLAGSIGGGATGAAVDDENPLRGAAVGALAGGAAGVAAGRMASRRGGRIAAERARTEAFDRELLGLAERRAAGPREGMPVWTDAQRAAAQAERELSYPEITARDRKRRGEIGSIGFTPEPNKNVIKSDLSKAEAVSEMKALSAAGVRAEMRKNPNGFFSIVKRGEPQAVPAQKALQLSKKNLPTPVQTYLMGTRSQAGFVSRTETALKKPEYDKLLLSSADWTKRLGKDPDVSLRELGGVWLRHDGHDLLNRDQIVNELRKGAPANRITREVKEHTGGKEINDSMIQREAEYLHEQELEYLDEEIRSNMSAVTGSLLDAEWALRPVFGEEGARRFMDRVRRVGFKSADDDERIAWLSALVAEHGFGVEKVLEKSWERPLEALMKRRLYYDPRQLRFEGVRPEDKLLYEAAERHINRAVRRQQAALDNAFSAHNSTPEDHWQSAEENLRNSDEIIGEGNTEHHGSQRHNEELPYRELVHNDPFTLKPKTTHFENTTTSFVTGEIEDGVWNITHLQSDLKPNSIPYDLKPVEVRVQLGVASALGQAAEEGMRKITWPTSKEAGKYHGLGMEPAEMIYGKAAPAAIRRIMKWLDIPLADLGENHLFLSSETKAKILKYGVPILGVAGLAASQRYPGDTLSPEDQKLLGITP